MNTNQLKNVLPDYAKDIRLNLTTVLSEEGSPDLNQKQIFLIALGVAYALKDHMLIRSILLDSEGILSENDIEGCQSAATIMAMNNIYYRFTHLVTDKSFSNMPAKLRMNVIANPKINKTDFELISLAISAINGCGMCIDAHTNVLIKAGMTQVSIQSAVRIAAVFNAVSTALSITSGKVTN